MTLLGLALFAVGWWISRWLCLAGIVLVAAAWAIQERAVRRYNAELRRRQARDVELIRRSARKGER